MESVNNLAPLTWPNLLVQKFIFRLMLWAYSVEVLKTVACRCFYVIIVCLMITDNLVFWETGKFQ
jgi:hypothetical protein